MKPHQREIQLAQAGGQARGWKLASAAGRPAFLAREDPSRQKGTGGQDDCVAENLATSMGDDALHAVPKRYRDGALALGATRWQTTYRVVLPAARSGLLIAVMLGVGRAIGETMAVMMVTGNAANIPWGSNMLLQPVRTMTATIAAEMGEVARGSTHYHVLFGVGIVLFVITFAINTIAARVMGSRLRQRTR